MHAVSERKGVGTLRRLEASAPRTPVITCLRSWKRNKKNKNKKRGRMAIKQCYFWDVRSVSQRGVKTIRTPVHFPY